jgi:drug/metabolite transporter (DMT)-like permease
VVLREAILLATLIGGITILLGVWLVNHPSQSVQVVEESA